MMRHDGKPCLLFATEVEGTPRIALLNPDTDQVIKEITLRGCSGTLAGASYNALTHTLVCTFCDGPRIDKVLLDAETFREVERTDLSADTVFPAERGWLPLGAATDGMVFGQAGKTGEVGLKDGGTVPKSAIQLRTIDGDLVGELTYAHRDFTGMTRTALSWTLCDRARHEIVVLGPFGDEIGVARGTGSVGGMASITYDGLRDMRALSQLTIPGYDGPEGTPYHPATEWVPEPWLGRHRLYIANAIDQVIHAGYLVRP